MAACLVGLLALFVRLSHLGEVSLDFDEYLHALAGQQLVSEGKPLLPSGHAYARAFSYTWFVGQSIRWFGSSEASVRLPSAIFGTLLVLLAGIAANRWWGLSAAIVVMLLVAFDPYCLQMSRVCRMYAPFHLLYLLSLFAAYEALEESATALHRAGWYLTAAASSVLALQLQPLAVEAGASFLGYVGLQSLLQRKRKYFGFVLLAVAAVAALILVKPSAVTGLWHEVNFAPAYAAPWRYDYGFYVRHAWQVNPGIVLLLVPALIGCIRNRATLGWYLASATLIPIGLHSLIFDWKEDRYLLHVVPVILIAIGGAIAAWSEKLAARVVSPTVNRRKFQPTWFIVCLFLIPFGVAFYRGRSLSGLDGTVPRWRQVYAAMRPQIEPDDALIISVPLVSAYYLDHRLPDYILLNVLVGDSGHTTTRGPEGLYLDWYTNRPLVTTAGEMEEVFRRHPQGWIIVDRERFEAETCVPAEVRKVISDHCRLWPSQDPAIVIYRWGAS